MEYYKNIVRELNDLLERMEYESDDYWVFESERKALVHAIAIINDLIEERN